VALEEIEAHYSGGEHVQRALERASEYHGEIVEAGEKIVQQRASFSLMRRIGAMQHYYAERCDRQKKSQVNAPAELLPALAQKLRAMIPALNQFLATAAWQ